MSQKSQSGNAGVTILVIVVILIVAGVLFFRNRADAPVMVDDTASTTEEVMTSEESTMTSEEGAMMEDGAVEGSMEAAAEVEVQ